MEYMEEHLFIYCVHTVLYLFIANCEGDGNRVNVCLLCYSI